MKYRTLAVIVGLVTLWGTLAGAQQPPGKNVSKAKANHTGTAGQDASKGQIVQAATTDPAYVIGAEDMLNVNVWKEPEMSGTVPVRPDGKISLPLINDVQAAGYTPMQLAANVSDQLKRYLTEPRVTVTVTAINSRRVYLMGEVGHPGWLPMVASMTVLQALSSAGGFSQFANLKKIYVLRTENGTQVKLPVNYKDLISGRNAEQNFLLKPGDTIVVP